MRFADFDDYWNLQTQVSGPLALFVSSLDEEHAAAIRATLAPMLEPFASDDGYQIPSLALGVAAAAL